VILAANSFDTIDIGARKFWKETREGKLKLGNPSGTWKFSFLLIKRQRLKQNDASYMTKQIFECLFS